MPLFTNMIAAGEAGGILDTILKRMATYIEKSVKLSGQVKSAMIYPVAIIVIAGLVVGVILWKVIPTFAELFSGLGADLPLPTRIVIGLSNNLVRYFPFLAVGGAAAAYGLRTYYATPAGRRVDRSRRCSQMPVLGNIMKKIAVARFCRTLSTLDQLGRADSRRARDHRQDRRQLGRRGRDHDHAQEHRARRDDFRAAQGDRRVSADGRADDRRRRGDRARSTRCSAKIADFYEEEVDVAVAGLLTLLEPIMIAILGVVVGGIVIAMYLPIFDLISKLT